VVSSELRELAQQGLIADPGFDLRDLARACRDHAEEIGDVRFYSVSSALVELDRWWEKHEAHGGVPAELIDQLEHTLSERLPALLDEPEALRGAHLARDFRREVESLLFEPPDWVDIGYAKPTTDD
jgi:hypothetical protein